MSGTWFESQFQICVFEHVILRIYISFFLSFHCYDFEKKMNTNIFFIYYMCVYIINSFIIYI